MPKTPNYQNYFDFKTGYITEATALNFPANACKDINNMVINNDGSAWRRLGIDFEPGYSLQGTIDKAYAEGKAISYYKWIGAANSGTIIFGIVQIGSILYFFNMSIIGALSSNLVSTIDLTSFKQPGISDVALYPLDYDSGLGYLFLASNGIEPIYIVYDSVANTLTANRITIQIRDVNGINEPGIEPDNRPQSLTQNHNYNLQNQGWSSTNINTYYAADKVYPSNAQQWFAGKDSSGNFSATALDQIDFGNSQAPTGHFLLNVFNQDRASASGIAGIPATVLTTRPVCTCFYSGRVCFSGAEPGVILISSTIVSTDNLGKMYQEEDPTAENLNALAQNDGMYLKIAECGNIFKMVAVRDGLVIFADNGIWELSGVGAPFSATNFQVSKISTITAASTKTVINVEQQIIFLSQIGLYALVVDPVTSLLQPKNLSIDKVQTFLNSIQGIAKKNAAVIYNEYEKLIYIFYNGSSSYDGVNKPYQYDSLLTFNIYLQCWYKSSFVNDNTHPYIIGCLIPSNLIQIVNQIPVVDNSSNQVVDNFGNVVVINQSIVSGSSTVNFRSIRLYAITLVFNSITNKYSLTFSTVTNNNFLDWYSFDSSGVNYNSNIEIQSQILNMSPAFERLHEVMKIKQPQMVYCYFNRTETQYINDGNGNANFDLPSGAMLSIKWDFASSSAGNKWTTPVEAYRFRQPFISGGSGSGFDTGASQVISKTKIRGEGKILVVRLDSEKGKDMQVVGIALPIQISAQV